jgi:single-strand DNA-binding protein
VHAPSITVTGNVGTTPVLREVSGASVTSFRIANTPRRLDKTTGAWNDLPTTWFGVSVWRTTAENVVQSVKQGDRVVVTGRLVTRTWTTPEGEPRSGLDIEATHIGLDLGRAPAQVVKAPPLQLTSDPGEQVSGLPDPDLHDELDDLLEGGRSPALTGGRAVGRRRARQPAAGQTPGRWSFSRPSARPGTGGGSWAPAPPASPGRPR